MQKMIVLWLAAHPPKIHLRGRYGGMQSLWHVCSLTVGSSYQPTEVWKTFESKWCIDWSCKCTLISIFTEKSSPNPNKISKMKGMIIFSRKYFQGQILQYWENSAKKKESESAWGVQKYKIPGSTGINHSVVHTLKYLSIDRWSSGLRQLDLIHRRSTK